MAAYAPLLTVSDKKIFRAKNCFKNISAVSLIIYLKGTTVNFLPTKIQCNFEQKDTYPKYEQNAHMKEHHPTPSPPWRLEKIQDAIIIIATSKKFPRSF
ncbi:hypothetical protein MAR_035962 [Mya arenaria]|uniref:Uncharacterized protein n=1 Tax=Mya arenaria TaxID=6604 RepID=A0ABY7EUK6_MYAAR|nr:hypothetical protein MAR_035962 [Mya arenaria]